MVHELGTGQDSLCEFFFNREKKLSIPYIYIYTIDSYGA